MAQLPYFYHAKPLQPGSTHTLNEDSTRHIVQVLRMQEGDALYLCNGIGDLARARIVSIAKKNCDVVLDELQHYEEEQNKLHLAVAFTKNSSRNEWILEKATELGVRSIIPLVAQRSERNPFKAERWQNILVSAMLQSQQFFLPKLYPPMKTEEIFAQWASLSSKFIAHCDTQIAREPIATMLQCKKESIIMIGPEGDFTTNEIEKAQAAGFKGISLCAQRLRTETAAIAACSYFNLLNI